MRHPLLDRFPIISDQMSPDELSVILHELERQLTSGKTGSVVEFGCYSGTTSLFMQRLLMSHGGAERGLYVYDSFEGLPEKATVDESPLGVQFVAGELSASKKQFVRNFQAANLPLPVIHKGWFKDIPHDAVPDAISFAYLDGDYYDSIIQPLRLIEPRLVRGATVIVDDYGNHALPGARRAVDEWLQTHPVRMREEASLAVIYMP